jgi:DNA-binding GntR family transcriptional regulator
MARQSASAAVAQLLRERILTGAYPDGMALRQEALSQELGVSRVPVREALRELGAEGLVANVAYKGAVVAGVGLGELRERVEYRAVLETWLLSAAIPFLEDADLDAAEAIIREMESCTLEEWSALNWRFHAALYRRAGKPFVLDVLRQLHERIERYLRVHLQITHGRAKAHADHRQILALCRARDVQRATAALNAHILNVSDTLVASVQAARERVPSLLGRRRAVAARSGGVDAGSAVPLPENHAAGGAAGQDSATGGLDSAKPTGS